MNKALEECVISIKWFNSFFIDLFISFLLIARHTQEHPDSYGSFVAYDSSKKRTKDFIDCEILRYAQNDVVETVPVIYPSSF